MTNGGVGQQNATIYAQVKAMLKIPENLRRNGQLKDQKDEILRQLNQEGFARLDQNSQNQYLTKEIDHFSKKVQIYQEQEQRDRIINRCKGTEGNGGSS